MITHRYSPGRSLIRTFPSGAGFPIPPPVTPLREGGSPISRRINAVQEHGTSSWTTQPASTEAALHPTAPATATRACTTEAGTGTRAVAMKDHSTVLLSRPVVDGQPRYQVQCSCGRKTEVGSRKMVQQDQKAHRKEAGRKD